MEPQDKALQAAMAEEIRSRLGRMNKSQAWLGRQARISPSAWRRYFTAEAIDREVPLGTVKRIADVLAMTSGELITIAEDNAPRYVAQFMTGISDAERADLEAAIERVRPTERSQSHLPARNGTEGKKSV